MTINAPAAWLLALYVAVADEQGAPRASLTGTTQNDIIKEYLARGTYIFPPKPALRLTTDTIAFTTAEMPKWNPINLCSYHLQEAGADAVEEAAFALAAAVSVLDAAKARGAIPPAEFPKAVGRMSFFVNSGVKFITEICKLRAMGALWDEITRDRYGVTDPKLRLFRYGVQVNSLGLTEQQPENNVYRVLFGMLGVTLVEECARPRRAAAGVERSARPAAPVGPAMVAAPACRSARSRPTCWNMSDIFDGSKVIGEKVDQLKSQIREEMERIAKLGGAATQEALEYMKERLVASNAARVEAIERGDEIRVGVNAYQETEVSPLTAGNGHFMTVDESAEAEQIARLQGLAFGARQQESRGRAQRARTCRARRHKSDAASRSNAPRPA